jgi:hypothetical protein
MLVVLLINYVLGIEEIAWNNKKATQQLRCEGTISFCPVFQEA